MRAATRWIPLVLVAGALLFAVWLLSSDPAGDGANRAGDGTASHPAPVQEATGSNEGAVRVEDRTVVVDPAASASRPTRASVNGLVRFEGSTRVVRGGAVEVLHLDPRETLEPPDLVQAWSEDRKSDHESYEETSIRRDGSFEVMLPVGSILRRATLKPASLDDDLLAGFFDTERDLGDRILTEAGVTLSLEAWEGYTVSGRVSDATTGAPIPNARVLSVWWNLATSRYGTRTDERGEFRIGGLHPEVVPLATTTDVVAEHPDYVTARIAVPIDPAATEITGVEIALHRGVVVAGQVVDEESRPLRGAELHLYELGTEVPDLGRSLLQHVTTRSGPDGRFRFPAVVQANRPGGGGWSPYKLQLYGQHPDAVPSEVRGLDPQQPLDDVQLVLPSGVVFEIQALDPDDSAPLGPGEFQAVLTEGGIPTRAHHSAQDGRPTLEVRTHAGTPRTLEVGVWWEEDGRNLALYGSATIYAELTSENPGPIPVEVTLTETQQMPGPGLETLNATRFFGTDFELWLVAQGETGPQAGPFTVSLASDPYRIDTRTDAQGLLKVRLGGGRHFLELRSPGHKPQWLLIDAGARGLLKTSVRLQRQ